MQVFLADPGVGRVDAEVITVAGAEEEDAEADHLADGGCSGSALDAHAEDVDEQGIEPDVQNRAADHTDHGVEGVALKAELVIDGKGGGHKRRGDEDPAQILDRRGDQSLVLSGGAEELCDRLQENLADQHQEQAEARSQDEARCSHLVSLAGILLAEGAGDVVGGALADEEARRLDQRHDGQGDGDRRNGIGPLLAADGADEEGIRQVVERGNKHAHDRRDRELEDQLLHRRRGHADVFFLPQGFAVFGHGINSFRSDTSKGGSRRAALDTSRSGVVCSVEGVQMLEEFIHVHAVNHAGFLNGLAAGRGAAQAVHADRKEEGRGLGRDIQNVTDDGVFFNFCHECGLLLFFYPAL